MSSPKKKGGKKEPAGNAVNEFDEDAWSATFNQMTKDREEASDAGSIGAREACEMVHKILEGMEKKYNGTMNEALASLDTLHTGVETIEQKLNEVNEQISQ